MEFVIKLLDRLIFVGILVILAKTYKVHAVEIYFSPGTDCENQIVKAIDGSKSEVSAAVYSINNKRIIAALVTAHKRGIKVRVLTDRIQAAGKSSRALELLDAGVPFRVHSKNKIEHNKFVVADSSVAINGSYNWTEPATRVNSENCAVMPERNAVLAYRNRFELLWLINTQERSNVDIQKIKAKRSK